MTVGVLAIVDLHRTASCSTRFDNCTNHTTVELPDANFAYGDVIWFATAPATVLNCYSYYDEIREPDSLRNGH